MGVESQTKHSNRQVQKLDRFVLVVEIYKLKTEKREKRGYIWVPAKTGVFDNLRTGGKKQGRYDGRKVTKILLGKAVNKIGSGHTQKGDKKRGTKRA